MTGSRSVLLITADDFADTRLAPLPSATADSEALAKILADEDIGGYDVQLMRNPTTHRALLALEQFFRGAATDELKVLYFAGHGLLDSAGRLHLAVADSQPDLLAATTVSAAFIREVTEDSKARCIVIVLDCCYSGAFPTGLTARSAPVIDAMQRLGTSRGRVVITSSGAHEYAFDVDPISTVSTGDIQPSSAFTSALVEGLRTGAADLDGDGLIEVRELYEYVRERVRQLARNQTPTMTATLDGPLYFASARVPTIDDDNKTTEPVAETPTEKKTGPQLDEVDTAVEPAVETPTEKETGPLEEVETAVDWATDAPAQHDHLNRASLADVLATRLREVRRESPSTSFLMHIDGAWGTGKSSLLNFLDERLADEFTIVRFDAWRQARIGPPWWTLLSATRRTIANSRTWWSAGLLRVAETFARARRSGAPYVLALVLLTVLIAALAAVAWPRVAANEPIGNLVKGMSAILASAGVLWAGALVASRFLLWESAKGARLFEQSTASPMDEVAAHFDWMLRKSKKPVLFFIDDLDRCADSYVVELLDSVQTLVRDTPVQAKKGTDGRSAAYFIVAADGAWLRRSYESAYESFGNCVSTPGYPLGYLFLDKLFQLTVPVPMPTARAQAGFLDRLLRLADSRSDAQIGEEVQDAKARIARDVGDEASILRVLDEASAAAREDLVADAARALATPQTRTRTEHALRRFLPLLHSNPRNVKKFLNTYSVLRSVRVLENNTVASNALALWTILRVRWPAMADHLEADPEAIRGIVEPLWAPECIPETLRGLAADNELREVVMLRDGGPLTPRLIRQCCGADDPNAD